MSEVGEARLKEPKTVYEERYLKENDADALFRRILDAEMKDPTSHSLHLKYKKEEKEAIGTKEEEEFPRSSLQYHNILFLRH